MAKQAQLAWERMKTEEGKVEQDNEDAKMIAQADKESEGEERGRFFYQGMEVEYVFAQTEITLEERMVSILQKVL